MMTADIIREILSLYKKHGWNLRRVLLSGALRKNLGRDVEKLFGEAEIVADEIDAVWFTRSGRAGQETWELRRLSASPFALVEVFSDLDDEAVRREVCRAMVDKLKNSRN